MVDHEGLPHAIAVTTANVTDRKGGLLALQPPITYLSKVKHVLVDYGYVGASFAEAVFEAIGAKTTVVKRNELHTFKVLPKRWIVERSFGWLEKHRRLWKNCEKLLHTSKQMVVLAFISILLHRS